MFLYFQCIAVYRQKDCAGLELLVVAVYIRAVRPAALGLSSIARHPEPDVGLGLIFPKLQVYVCACANQTCVFAPSLRSNHVDARESGRQTGSASSCWGQTTWSMKGLACNKPALERERPRWVLHAQASVSLFTNRIHTRTQNWSILPGPSAR